MGTRSATVRIDDLESSVGSIEKNLEKNFQQIEKLSNDVASKLNSTESSDGEEGGDSGRSKKKSYDKQESNRFLAVKGRKLEIPSFDGSDPDGWILRAERYFALNRLTQEEKIDVSFIAFEGAALKWFQWENRRHPILRWEDLRKLLVRQFRSTAAGTLCEQFLAVKQEGTVEEFRMKFVELASPLEGIPEEVFMSQFINGLENSIKAEVRLLNPVTLEEAMELAVRIEVKNAVITKEKSLHGSRKSTSSFTSGKGVFGSTNSVNMSNSIVNSSNKTGSEFRRLSDQEVQQKRALGLCYRCDEKFSPGHRCKK